MLPVPELAEQSFEAPPCGYTSQTNCLLPESSTRFEVSPIGSLRYMVELGSGAWSSPRKCPNSCVAAFWTSLATQEVERALGEHGGESTIGREGGGGVQLDVGVDQLTGGGDEGRRGERHDAVEVVPAVVDVAARARGQARVAGGHHRGAEAGAVEHQVLVRPALDVADGPRGRGGSLGQVEVAARLQLGLPGLRRAGDGGEGARAEGRVACAALHEGHPAAGSGADRPVEAVRVGSGGGLAPDVLQGGLPEQQPGQEGRGRELHWSAAWTEARSAETGSGARAAGGWPGGATSSRPSRLAGTARLPATPSPGCTR